MENNSSTLLQLQARFGEDTFTQQTTRDEMLTLWMPMDKTMDVLTFLKKEVTEPFKLLFDLTAIDERTKNRGANHVPKSSFTLVYHLFSFSRNEFIRLKVGLVGDFPTAPSISSLWANANWYEREAFDFFGILFEGHNDLRRILTDYGFIGHPFRKDFPVSGYVEMRYDPEQKRVIYQPVTIEPREIIPRVIREEKYGIK